MKAQATDEQRRAVATHLLDNGADHDALAAQVDALWSDLQARHRAKSTRTPVQLTPGARSSTRRIVTDGARAPSRIVRPTS